MEWVLRSPQIHSTFSNLGVVDSDGYHVNENCNEFLEAILNNIIAEDKYLRTYRRNISFGRNIEKDFIPLLIHAKDDKTIELLVQILVNLTIPIECLLSVDIMSKNDFGRHTIFDINNLLTSTKEAFTDHQATKVLINFLKKCIDSEQKDKVTIEHRTNISNTLLLLRNILHIPENNSTKPPSVGSSHSVQNHILWNLFSQSIDKVLIKLMTVPNAYYWGVTMVQLIALLYKDQHVVILQKLLNTWLESSLSESSDDNESNTSPPGRDSEDSSPSLTSDPTSDSSDSGGSGKTNNLKSVNNLWEDPISGNSDQDNSNCDQICKPETDPLPQKVPLTQLDYCVVNNTDDSMKCDTDTGVSSAIQSEKSDPTQNNGEKIISEISDCGYGTQIENQEYISTTTSSNDDEPAKKPVHQKPHNPKQRTNTKVRFGISLQDRKRKKVSKRGKSNIINVMGLAFRTPTDEDIANVLKEFTVDFLLKGYNFLVKTLHNEILTNLTLEIDTSHFFWLVTYFLKFATQIELDLLHLESVLTFDIVSYLTAEGVNLCEQFELGIKDSCSDLTPNIRRLHLVVTSIREFVQAIEMYEKFSHLKIDDRELLVKLQIQMCETAELRSLLVLLLRHYNPKYHSKQYLEDLIVTNHILLMFLDNVMRLPDYNCSSNIMTDHIRQFATPHIMFQYGTLLEDYTNNGQFVNDCIFTIMHHVSGELDSLDTLFQPKILKSFSSIWKSEFEMCDDWSDLIEYVVNTFIKKTNTLNSTANNRLRAELFEDKRVAEDAAFPQLKQIKNVNLKRKASVDDCEKASSSDRWTSEETSSLGWLYVQCELDSDIANINELTQLLQDEGIYKSRDSVIRELYKQNIISHAKFQSLMKPEENDQNSDLREEEISKLCEQLIQDGKSVYLKWVQSILLDTCQVKIYLEKKEFENCNGDETLLKFEVFKNKDCDAPVVSPVAYHSLMLGRSVPLIPWNCNQASICNDMKFFQLLHKLGFHMPVDTAKIFIRIPHFWTANFLYEIASKLWAVDKSKLKFSLDFSKTKTRKAEHQSYSAYSDYNKGITKETQDNIYQVHKEKHLATMVKFTPMPGCSYASEANEGESQNWLKVVQKSQELKITLTTLGRFKEGASSGAENIALPTVLSVKQEISTFNLQLNDADCNSVCDTASVTSDLTRMYVSDEEDRDEKDRKSAQSTKDEYKQKSNKRSKMQNSTPSF